MAVFRLKVSHQSLGAEQFGFAVQLSPVSPGVLNRCRLLCPEWRHFVDEEHSKTDPPVQFAQSDDAEEQPCRWLSREFWWKGFLKFGIEVWRCRRLWESRVLWETKRQLVDLQGEKVEMWRKVQEEKDSYYSKTHPNSISIGMDGKTDTDAYAKLNNGCSPRTCPTHTTHICVVCVGHVYTWTHRDEMKHTATNMHYVCTNQDTRLSDFPLTERLPIQERERGPNLRRQRLASLHRDLSLVQIDLVAACTDSGKLSWKCEYPP